GNRRVRAVGTDGIITTIAGNGNVGLGANGAPATQTGIGNPLVLALAPDNSLYVGANEGSPNFTSVWKITPLLPGFAANDIAIASEDGAELYQFNAIGRHLRTLNALTGAALYSFSYDSAGRLLTVTDGDGNVTTIQRDGNGNPTGILAPFGQQTTLALEANGYLASV